MRALFRHKRALYFYEAGKSETPLLFIHGSCCDHTFFAPQLAHFQRNHRVVAVDLFGHGRSDKQERDYTIPGFSDDLIWLGDKLGLHRFVAVGHSMGGGVALEMAARYPNRVRAAAALDSTLLPTPEGLNGTPALMTALRTPDWREALRRHFRTAFEPYDDPEIKEEILARLGQTPQHVVVSLFENFGRWDGSAAARACQAPLLYLAASRYRTGLRRLRELNPRLITGQVVGSGHFLQLMVPDQVNLMLERFLDLVL